jgi:ABC-2 type transport system ATP-binding protein
LLFLDEPTTGLDPQSRRQLWTLLEQFRAGGGSILLTTHYMDEAETLCDRVGIVDKGRVIALDTPRNLIASLGGNHVVDVAFADPVRTPPQAELQALPAVRDVRQQDGAWSLTTTQIHETVPALLSAAAAHGAALTSLATHSATLEDVFVTLTGRHLRDS